MNDDEYKKYKHIYAVFISVTSLPLLGVRTNKRMEPHPLVSSFTARIQFLGKVSQVVIVVEVAEGNQILEENSKKNISGKKKKTKQTKTRLPV